MTVHIHINDEDKKSYKSDHKRKYKRGKYKKRKSKTFGFDKMMKQITNSQYYGKTNGTV